MKRFIVLLITVFSSMFMIARVTIEMEQDGGVYKVPCVVNGLRMKFVFDTGAANVCISETMANYMLENDYLNSEDIIGTGQSSVADGRIVDHLKIRIATLEIGGMQLDNIEAIVIMGQSAPLLLGQTAIEKMGEVSIIGNKLIIENIDNCSSENLDNWVDLASSFYENSIYDKALVYYKKIYDCDGLTDYGLFVLAECYYYTNQYKNAMSILHNLTRKIENHTIDSDCTPYYIAHIYDLLACCYSNSNHNACISYNKKALEYLTEEDWEFAAEIYCRLARIYYVELEDYSMATPYAIKGIRIILCYKYPRVYEEWKQNNFDNLVNVLDRYNWGYDQLLGDLLALLSFNYLHSYNLPPKKLLDIANKMGSDIATYIKVDFSEYY